MTDTDFDLDDEPVLIAEGEVAAAIWGHLKVCAIDYANLDKVRNGTTSRWMAEVAGSSL